MFPANYTAIQTEFYSHNISTLQHPVKNKNTNNLFSCISTFSACVFMRGCEYLLASRGMCVLSLSLAFIFDVCIIVCMHCRQCVSVRSHVCFDPYGARAEGKWQE